jgi:hypothetical protein
MKIAQIIQADSWGDVTPEALERGIGGREGALIRLATEWAKLGHEVTCFVPTKKAVRYSGASEPSNTRGEGGFHEYIPGKLARHMLAAFPYDAVVAWECPSIFSDERILEKQKVRLTHMQVAHFHDQEMEMAERFSTGVVALSEWARDFLVHEGLVHKNLYVRPNGVDISQYPIAEVSRESLHSMNGPPSFVYSSSPDRGLWPLLKMWPRIREVFGDAKLYVAYGVEKYVSQLMWAHSRNGEMCLDIIDGMNQPGVIDLGKIGQKQLAQLQMKATAWLYPADTIQATETGCITAIENMAAGNPCFMSDADCLESEFSKVSIINKLPFDQEDWIAELGNVLYDPAIFSRMQSRGRKFAETRDWKVIAPTWLDLFEENKSLS